MPIPLSLFRYTTLITSSILLRNWTGTGSVNGSWMTSWTLLLVCRQRDSNWQSAMPYGKVRVWGTR